MRILRSLVSAPLFLLPAADGAIVINEVSPGGDRIEFYNTGGSAVDINSWWVCSLFGYSQLSGLTVDSGTLNLGAGSYVVVSGFSMNDTAADLGLYTSTSFGSSAAMEDFVQWGSGDNGRESVAAAKLIWTAGDFVAGPNFETIQFDEVSAGVSSAHYFVGSETLGATNIPEPSPFLLGGLCMVAACWRRRRRVAPA